MKKILLIIFIFLLIVSIVIATNTKFIVRNKAGTVEATMNKTGHAVFKSTCNYGGTCAITSGTCTKHAGTCTAPTGDSFIIKNKANTTILGYIDANGVFCVKGSITQSSSMAGVCGTTSFIIRNNTGGVAACIDGSGNFYSRKTIICNGAP